MLVRVRVRVRVRVSVGEAAGVLERGGHGVSNDVDGHVSQLIVLDALRLTQYPDLVLGPRQPLDCLCLQYDGGKVGMEFGGNGTYSRSHEADHVGRLCQSSTTYGEEPAL